MSTLPQYVVHRYVNALDEDPVETLTFPHLYAVQDWATEWLRTRDARLNMQIIAPSIEKMAEALVDAGWTYDPADPEALVVAFNDLASEYDQGVRAEERCPACGEPTDYCPGHGEIGDPTGHLALELHDNGVHSDCHPLCSEKVVSGQ